MICSISVSVLINVFRIPVIIRDRISFFFGEQETGNTATLKKTSSSVWNLEMNLYFILVSVIMKSYCNYMFKLSMIKY